MQVVETCGSATWMSAGSNHKSCRLISRAALNTKDEMVALSNAVTTLRYCRKALCLKQNKFMCLKVAFCPIQSPAAQCTRWTATFTTYRPTRYW